MENPAQPADKATMEKQLESAVADFKTGTARSHEIRGVNLEGLLREMTGCEVRQRFFGELKEVRAGLNKQGCVVLVSVRNFARVNEPAPRFIPLDEFSSIVSALDRVLSRLVLAYVDTDPWMAAMCKNHVIHSGLLIRALLGETDAVRTLYPEHVIGVPNNPGLNQALIAKTRQAYEEGSLARLCARHYGLDEDALGIGLERAVSIQRKILPLLPFEVHRLVDALEARISLQKAAEKVKACGGESMNQKHARTLNAGIHAQILRGQRITQSLRADFHMDPSKMFCLDDSLMDTVDQLFGSELSFLRPVLATYLEKRRVYHDSDKQIARVG
jgi:hypothetical protein